MKKIEEEKLNVGGYLNYYKGYLLDNGMDCVDIARALSHVMNIQSVEIEEEVEPNEVTFGRMVCTGAEFLANGVPNNLPPEDGSVNLRGTCQGVPVTILMDPGVNYSIILVTQQPYLELSDMIQI